MVKEATIEALKVGSSRWWSQNVTLSLGGSWVEKHPNDLFNTREELVEKVVKELFKENNFDKTDRLTIEDIKKYTPKSWFEKEH